MCGLTNGSRCGKYEQLFMEAMVIRQSLRLISQGGVERMILRVYAKIQLLKDGWR